MAACFEGDKECVNCGALDDLLVCSRCHSARFCSVKCQKAYWPFHRDICRKNEFADLLEEREPTFAHWLRQHGKQAVLKDEEIDRLERAGAAAAGPSRHEVLQSMYGRLCPKPKVPCYTPLERTKMVQRTEQAALQARGVSAARKAWDAIRVPRNMGMECTNYKWLQNQSYVLLYILLPENVLSRQVAVQLTTTQMTVMLHELPVIDGELYQAVKAEDSIWTIEDGLLHACLLKRNRKGNYANGCTCADTFWKSLFKRHSPDESIQLKHPPSEYYRLEDPGHIEGQPILLAAA